jgi:hypothetical protein
MTEKRITNEEIMIEKIKFIAKFLGIGFQRLNSDDLGTIRTYLIDQMHGNVWAANLIILLAKQIVEGRNPQKQLKKLINRVPSSTIKRPDINRDTDHFSKRINVAQHKIPVTRPIGHTKWGKHDIKRGPRRYSGK